jgi:intracellular septation protein A
MVPMAIFLAVFLTTKNILLAIVVGMAAGIAQVGYGLIHGKPTSALQWASLALIVGFGGATLVTHDPRFIMFKPTTIHLILGAVMLRPGWMERYVPGQVRDAARPALTAFGFIWAGLMFLTAGLNVAVMVLVDPITWATFNLVFPPISMITLFLIQNIYMRTRPATPKKTAPAAVAGWSAR